MTTSTNLPGHPQVPNLAEVPGSILGRDSAVTKVLLRRSAAARRARYSTVKIWVGAICAGVVVIPVVLANVLPLPDPIVGDMADDDPDDRLEMLRGAIIPLVVGVTVLVYVHLAARNAPKV
jgi:hypothetical protein